MNKYSIVDVGKELEKYGLRVGENPYFGTGKVGKHSPGSYHYAGQAIDVTDWRPDVAPAFEGGKPIPWKQRTGELAWRAKQSGLFTEALGPGDKGHDTHVHLALKDKVAASPQLFQWIATGRYKTPEGKLTDIMPGAQQQLPVAVQPPAQTSTPGDTYILIPGGETTARTPTKDFLVDFIKQQALQGPTASVPPTSNMTQLLQQAFNQQPNYLG